MNKGVNKMNMRSYVNFYNLSKGQNVTCTLAIHKEKFRD